MGTLSYSTTISIDGYVNDADGDFQWSAPNDPVFDTHVERMAAVSTEVLGRKTYELMRYWETDHHDFSPAEEEFARRWRKIQKVVVSSTLTPDHVAAGRDRLVPRLDLDELRKIVADATGTVEIFGPTTAAPAIRAGMIDEFNFFVLPKVVGGGLRALPDDVRLDLGLAEHTVFDDGVVYLRYAPG